jgi:tetratricopeptide (TPR) repeat protein
MVTLGLRRTAPAAAPPPSSHNEAAPPVPPVEVRPEWVPPTFGLCGTEIAPLDDDASGLTVPDVLRLLSHGVPPMAEVERAIEDYGLSNELSDLTQLTRDALEGWSTAEQEASEPPMLDDTTREEAADAWIRRSDLLRNLGRAEQALDAARNAERSLPDSMSSAHVFLALRDLNRRDEARSVVENALRVSRDPAERAFHLEHLGQLCSETHDEPCAERAYQDLGRTGENEGLAAFLRGARAAESGDHVTAQAAFEEALSARSDFASAASLAAVTTLGGQVDEGRRRWQAAAQYADGPGERADVLAGLGDTYLQEGDTVSAWLVGSMALAVTGRSARSADARWLLAVTSAKMGDLAEARVQARLLHEANRYDDVSNRWYSSLAEEALVGALSAETRGDKEGAKRGWLAVARSMHPQFAFTARKALRELCSPT